jgi:2-methylisocitrate lyase-like PEP mutase family enzyme
MTGLLGPAGGRKGVLGELLAAGEMVLAPEGLESAIERARLYRRPGADILFNEAPQSVDEIRELERRFGG